MSYSRILNELKKDANTKLQNGYKAGEYTDYSEKAIKVENFKVEVGYDHVREVEKFKTISFFAPKSLLKDDKLPLWFLVKQG